jgi:hypothetical protein
MSDSDDDLPIAELIKKRKIQAALNSVEEKNIVIAIKKEKQETAARKETRKEEKGGKVSRSTSTLSSEFYNDTSKGYLVQTLLQRWWYAIEWPTEDDIGTPPAGYESLDGFKGVFISTKVFNFSTTQFKTNPIYTA